MFNWNGITEEFVMDSIFPDDFNETVWSLHPYFTWFHKQKVNPGRNDAVLITDLEKESDDDVATLEKLKRYLSVCEACHTQLQSQ